MVDTVILHAPLQAASAGVLRDALTERFAITCEIGPAAEQLSFGPQVLRIGVLAGRASESAEEVTILALCNDGEGDRILMCAENAASPRAGENVQIIAYSGDAEGDAQRVRAALAALSDRSRKGKKKNDNRVALELAIAPPAAKSSHARALGSEGGVLVAPKQTPPKPSARAATAPPPLRPEELDITPETHTPRSAPPVASAQVSQLEVHDPDKARRAHKVGFFAGIGLGLAVMSILVGLYIRSHEVQSSVAEATPATALEPASRVVPAAPPEAPPQTGSEPELRGTLDPSHVEN